MSESLHFGGKIIVGYAIVVFSYIYGQVSNMAGGVIDKGLDAGLSLGLLILGLVVLGWYHWKYIQHAREERTHYRKTIDAIVEKQDEKDLRVERLAVDHSEKFESLLKETVVTNKGMTATNEKLCIAVDKLTDKINNNA